MQLKSSDNFFTKFLVSLGILLLVSILHFSNLLKPLESGLLFLISKPEKVFYQIGQATTDFLSTISSIEEIKQENINYQNELSILRSDLASLSEIKLENEMLREQLGFQQKIDHKTVPAFVTGKDPNNLLQTITINKGSNSGLRENLPVISSKGLLVGKVSEVFSSTSTIMLITDSASIVNAYIQESRATGLTRGEHGLGLIIDTIPQDKVIKKEDTVITSGLGNILPRGLVIGYLGEINNTENELFQSARINPAVEFDKLEMVFIITEFNQ